LENVMMDIFQKFNYPICVLSPLMMSHLVESLFTQVTELEFVSDLVSYSGGSLAAGRVTHARQVVGKLLDKERYPGPSG
jgi:hypothetical protein